MFLNDPSIYGLTRVTAPAAPILTTAQAKAHLIYEDSDQDTYIDGLVAAVTRKIEQETGNALITQTWKATFDRFPWSAYSPLKLPLSPAQSISWIKYYDTDGVLQTWDASKYQLDLDSRPARIFPDVLNGEFWPSTVAYKPNAIQVQFICGWGDASTAVPDELLIAAKLLLTHVFENRSAVDLQGLKELPKGVDYFLNDYRVKEF